MLASPPRISPGAAPFLLSIILAPSLLLGQPPLPESFAISGVPTPAPTPGLEPGPAVPRDPPGSQLRFTVPEAVAHGLLHNPELCALRRAIGVAEGEVLSAALERDTSLKAALARERKRTQSAGEVGRSRASTGGYGLSTEIDITARRVVEVQRKRAELDLARLSVVLAELRLRRHIQHAAAKYIARTGSIAVLHNPVWEAKPLMWELTHDRPADRLRAQIMFLDNQQGWVNDRVEVLEAEAELTRLMGLPPDTRLFISGSVDPTAPDTSYEHLRKIIFTSNLDIQMTHLELRAARYALESAMREKAPRVGASWFRAGKREDSSPGGLAVADSSGRGLSLSLPLLDQGQGAVWSADARVAATETQIRATRWDAETDLYELWQTLALVRGRVRLYEAYLERLKRTIEEFDPEEFEAGRIEFDTWEKDIKRYHADGAALQDLKIAYQDALATLELISGGCFEHGLVFSGESEEPACRPPSESFAQKSGRKLRHGLGNVVLAPVEAPAAVYGNVRDRGPQGLLTGPVEGAITVVERAAAGALDVVTAPLPWPHDAMEPVTPEPDRRNPWWGSWSLKYYHPQVEKGQRK